MSTPRRRSTTVIRRLAACVGLLGLCLGATAQQPPALVQQRDGGVTSVSVPGQLAPTRSLDCLDVEEITGAFTPPDLYTGIQKCIAQGDFDRAARMYLVAGMYARFDAERVADVSARDAGQMLGYQLGRSMTPDQRAALGKSTRVLLEEGPTRTAFCVQAARLEHPDYGPDYMILHGMDAMIAVTGGNAPAMEKALVPGFDAQAAWAKIPQAYLHCS